MPSLIIPQEAPEAPSVEQKVSFRKKILELLDEHEELQQHCLMLTAQVQLVQHRAYLSESNAKQSVHDSIETSPRNSVLSSSQTIHGNAVLSSSQTTHGSVVNPQLRNRTSTESINRSPRNMGKKLISLDVDEDSAGIGSEDPPAKVSNKLANRKGTSFKGVGQGHQSSVQNSVPTDTSNATTMLGEAILPAFATTGHRSPSMPSFENFRTHKSIQEAHLFQADCGVLMPSSFKRMFWNLCLICCLLFELWAAPFQLIFCDSDAVPSTITSISYAMTALFLFDIGLNFNTGYFKNGKIVMHRREIIRHYLRLWFWLDLISSIPWPFEGGGFFRWLRFGKIVRLMKAIHYVEFTRVVQALSSMHTGKIQIDFHLRRLYAPCGLFLFLFIHAHLHGCLWAACQPNWTRAPTFEEALNRYADCFIWAFGAFTTGTWRIPSIKDTDTSKPFWWVQCALELIVMWERICLLTVVIIWGVCQAHTRYDDYILLQKLKSDALEYLKSHNVSFGTQVQVMYILHETGSVRQKQRHFRDLMNNDLPVEVKRKICSELWSERLKSLELIDMMHKLHHHFLVELALLVRQEVFASKALIYHYGDASIASYYVMDGSVVCITDFDVPEFTQGHWIGETALVNRLLRRRMTVMAAQITVLMAVPADGFHELLNRNALVDQFQDICHEYLWKGLCGRCGALGHHNADSCPTMMECDGRVTGKLTRKAIWSSLPGAPTYNRGSDLSKSSDDKTYWDAACGHSASMKSRNSASGGIMQKMTSLASGQFLGRVATLSRQPIQTVNRDLKQFLNLHNLGRLTPTMSMLGLKTLQDLINVQFEELNSLLAESGEHLAPSELLALSPKSINDFREKVARTVQRHIFGRRNYHYVFLSHSKSEAGTEATLMQKELCELIAGDMSMNETHPLDVPVFLDSENLSDLREIQEKVQKSHNLAVMLTSNVLSRPWVLVEIVTAIRSNIQVVPVRVTKPGVEFLFPGEEFYEQLSQGVFLDADGQQVLTDAGVSILEVEASLREMFRHIAVPYSPHARSETRMAELKDFLKRCRFKTGDAA